MKRFLLSFLQVMVAVVATSLIIFMLWEPHLEGRNIHATVFEIYFKDPFLAYVYIGSIPFFVALYQIGKVLGHVRNNKVFSEAVVKSLRIIKYCTLVTTLAIAGGGLYLMIVTEGDDDPSGALMLGIITILISLGISFAATTFERAVGNSIEKS